MEQLAKLPKAAQYIIAIVLGAAILAAGYFFIIQGR